MSRPSRSSRLLPALLMLASLLCFTEQARSQTQPTIPPEKSFQKTQASTALAILKQALGPNPPATKRVLRVIYFTPKDREPARDWEPRIGRVVEDFRTYLAQEMDRNGFGKRQIALEMDKEKLVIHLVTGRGSLKDYSGKSGGAIRDEAAEVLKKKGIRVDQETLLIICNLSAGEGEKTSRDAPYYGGGSARSGTAWVTDASFMDPLKLGDKKNMVTDGQYGRISVGRYNTIFLGGTVHELGHGLGLPHNRESGAERSLGTSLMGSGNHRYKEEMRGEGKGAFLAFSDALRLVSHPLFSGTEHELKAKATAKFEQLKFEEKDKSFVVEGVVKSQPRCYGVVAYLDPAGGGDYDARTVTAVPGAKGDFRLECADLVAGKTAELRLVACLANGAVVQKAFPYRVTPKGKPELGDVRVDLLLGQAFAYWRKADRKEFEAEVARVTQGLKPNDPVVLWANTLKDTLGPPTEPTPDKAARDKKVLSLSQSPTSLAKVGYGKVIRNYFPSGEPGEGTYLSVKGQRHAEGLYAHSPSSYKWKLGGKWDRLTGKAGIQDGAYGEAVFVIRVDGQERWRSRTMRVNETVSYDLDLRMGQELELAVENTDKGNGSAWSVWLQPKLMR